jgi:serine/threonine protein kinase
VWDPIRLGYNRLGPAQETGTTTLPHKASAGSPLEQTPASGSAISAEADTLAPGSVVDDYVLEQRIGLGGSGVVYAAVHRVIGKRAAIKVMHHSGAGARQPHRFLEEARSVNRIAHPNIIDIFSLGTLDDGRCYLVMELLKGRSLAACLAEGSIPRTDTVPVLLQVCEALAAAHEKRIVHRDLKPENIFLMPGAGGLQVKLLDFGLAKPLEDDPDRDFNTREGLMVGTPRYLSPEQAQGRAVDERSDIYSLGVVTYELLLDRPPFLGSGLQLITQHLAETPPAPQSLWPEIPHAVDDLLRRALEKAPEKRPTLNEFMAVLLQPDLASALERDPAPRRMAAVAERPQEANAAVLPPRRLWRWTGWASLVLGALAITAGGVALGPRAPSAPPSEPNPPFVSPLPAPQAKVTVPALPEPPDGILEVRLSADDEQIWVDGKPISTSSRTTRIQLKPIVPHEVRVLAPGRAAYVRKVVTAPGTTLSLSVHIPPARRPASRAVEARSTQPVSEELLVPSYGGRK